MDRHEWSESRSRAFSNRFCENCCNIAVSRLSAGQKHTWRTCAGGRVPADVCSFGGQLCAILEASCVLFWKPAVCSFGRVPAGCGSIRGRVPGYACSFFLSPKQTRHRHIYIYIYIQAFPPVCPVFWCSNGGENACDVPDDYDDGNGDTHTDCNAASVLVLHCISMVLVQSAHRSLEHKQ